ncbi:MAG: HNH endonuclease [Firmicutes bacterium]|nr:HNH endonuclease [Candidatus Colivicinus equi]
MNKRTKATNISLSTKQIVWERDNHQCIICHSPYAFPNAHYVSRAYGGLGVERNVVTLCPNCHNLMDNSPRRKELKAIVKRYLQRLYDDWNEEELIYKK